MLFFFAANALASINITCVPGSFVDGSVHSSAPRCVPCTAGKFTNIYNATACADCANHSSGTFSEDGATQCTVCPLGQYKVQSGTFSEDGATQCTECPLGKYHPPPICRQHLSRMCGGHDHIVCGGGQLRTVHVGHVPGPAGVPRLCSRHVDGGRVGKHGVHSNPEHQHHLRPRFICGRLCAQLCPEVFTVHRRQIQQYLQCYNLC